MGLEILEKEECQNNKIHAAVLFNWELHQMDKIRRKNITEKNWKLEQV